MRGTDRQTDKQTDGYADVSFLEREKKIQLVINTSQTLYGRGAEASLLTTASWLEATADSGFEQTHYCFVGLSLLTRFPGGSLQCAVK